MGLNQKEIKMQLKLKEALDQAEYTVLINAFGITRETSKFTAIRDCEKLEMMDMECTIETRRDDFGKYSLIKVKGE